MEVCIHKCPNCGAKTRKIHDYRIQKIKHLKWFERLSYIFYKKRRYRCVDCRKRFYEKNNFVDRYKRFTKEWNQAVRVRSVQAKTFKKVAQLYRASISTIIRRFDALAEQELQETRELPSAISIDEYKGDTSEGKYQLIIADALTREPIDILPNRKGKTITQYLQKMVQM